MSVNQRIAKRTCLYAISATLLIAGCAQTRFAREEKSAQRQINLASEEGGTTEALVAARGTLAFARASETRAMADLEGGRADLQSAQERQRSARMLADEKRSAHGLTDAKLAAAEENVVRATARQEDLRAMGVSEADIDSAAGREASRARQQLASMTAASEIVPLELSLAELECEAAATAIQAAKTRISSAEQRLDLARALYRRAEQQARSVEMEALSGQRDVIDTRINQQ